MDIHIKKQFEQPFLNHLIWQKQQSYILKRVCCSFYLNNVCAQGVSLPARKTLRSDSRHEAKHSKIGNHRTETSSVGARES